MTDHSKTAETWRRAMHSATNGRDWPITVLPEWAEEIAQTMDFAARIQSADTDTSRDEAFLDAIALDDLDPNTPEDLAIAQSKRLLDVVRRLRAERDAAIADANECRTLRDQAIRSLEARTKELLRAEDRVAERGHGGMVAGEGRKKSEESSPKSAANGVHKRCHV